MGERSYAVFVRLPGHTIARRLTPADRTTRRTLFAARLPNTDWAQRRADEYQRYLDGRHPGGTTWPAPF